MCWGAGSRRKKIMDHNTTFIISIIAIWCIAVLAFFLPVIICIFKNRQDKKAKSNLVDKLSAWRPAFPTKMRKDDILVDSATRRITHRRNADNTAWEAIPPPVQKHQPIISPHNGLFEIGEDVFGDSMPYAFTAMIMQEMYQPTIAPPDSITTIDSGGGSFGGAGADASFDSDTSTPDSGDTTFGLDS